MFMPWSELAAFLDSGFRELVETDFAQIRYSDVGMATWLAMGVGMALVLTVVRLGAGRKRHVRQHSGHVIAVSHRKPLWIRLAHSTPKLFLAAALVLLVVSVADPFLTATEEVGGYVESRVRIDLVDTSGSMAWEFPETNTSKAEVARNAHLEFLDMRRDKNDRVSLWLFSTYPYMVDDFVMDDELYYFQVWDAPYVMTQRLDRAMVVPRDKVRIIPAEGDTNIVRPLQDIVKHFDRDEAAVGQGSKPNRAVLIITDAAVDVFPDAEFAELNRRNIVPYIIYINTSTASKSSFMHPTVPQLVAQIQAYGGDYFDVTDEDSLSKAYQAIDEREAVRVELRHRALKVPIYSRFLLVAMGLLAVGIPMGFVSELLWGTSP